MKRRNEVTVGILITVAIIILITGTLWLVRGGLRKGYTLYTRFPWGQSLKQGQAVQLAGVTVGFVEDVKLNPIGVIDVTLNVLNKYRVPNSAYAEVYPVGIFGDVVVALRVPNPTAAAFKPLDTIPSRTAATGLDALQARADTITASLERISRTLEAEFVTGGGIRDVRATISSINRLTAQIENMVAAQDRNLTATMATLRGAVDSAQIKSTLATFRQTAANADSLMQRLSSNTTQLQALLARLERGEGTAGKLMTDTLLYRDTRNLLMRVDSLIADFQTNPKKYINLRVF